jgi:hypothetical protein
MLRGMLHCDKTLAPATRTTRRPSAPMRYVQQGRQTAAFSGGKDLRPPKFLGFNLNKIG